jgi:hypothetical protein
LLPRQSPNARFLQIPGYHQPPLHCQRTRRRRIPRLFHSAPPRITTPAGTQCRDKEAGSKSQSLGLANGDTAAEELDRLRSNWLNQPEWTRTEVFEFPGSVDGPWKRYVDPATVDERGIGTVRYPRLVPKDAETAKELKKRTLTNLYNQRPTWLDLAHHRLDEAVFEAYGWPADLSDDDLLARLLELNLARAGSSVGPSRLVASRGSRLRTNTDSTSVDGRGSV